MVGGGIMGLGTAFHLSERGYRVTLLEKQKDVAKGDNYVPQWWVELFLITD